MNRIVILGQTCAGKSTVARTLSERLDLPLIDLDAIHYGPEWQQRPVTTKAEMFAVAAQGERWVVDGYSGFMREAVLDRADMAVWLDVPVVVSALRLAPRAIRRWMTGERCCGDNHERPFALLTRDSLFLYLAQTWAQNRSKYALITDEMAMRGDRVLTFRSTRAAVMWACTLDHTEDQT